MRKIQFLIGLTFAAVLGFGLGSCGSSSSSNNPLMCQATGSCTQAELTTYDNCIVAKCGSMSSTCNSGPCASYSSCASKCGCNDTACRTACGQPSSACETCLGQVGACVLGANCMAPACLTGGGTGGTSGGAGSTGALGGFSGGLGGSTGSGGTCADLLACCNAATNATVKSACMSEYTTLMSSGDAACGAFLGPVKSSICP